MREVTLTFGQKLVHPGKLNAIRNNKPHDKQTVFNYLQYLYLDETRTLVLTLLLMMYHRWSRESHQDYQVRRRILRHKR